MEVNENVSLHGFLFWDMVKKKRIQYDHHKILVLSDVNLPFHLLTQVSTLGISCLNLDHQLVWQTKCKNAL